MKLPVSPFFFFFLLLDNSCGPDICPARRGREGRGGGREGGCALMHGQSPARRKGRSRKEEECGSVSTDVILKSALQFATV